MEQLFFIRLGKLALQHCLAQPVNTLLGAFCQQQTIIILFCQG